MCTTWVRVVTVAFTVHITKVATGEIRQMQETCVWDESAVWLWEEGNYSCDCNRELFFCRAGGDPEPPDEGPCTRDRFTVRITDPSGEELYDSTTDGWH